MCFFKQFKGPWSPFCSLKGPSALDDHDTIGQLRPFTGITWEFRQTSITGRLYLHRAKPHQTDSVVLLFFFFQVINKHKVMDNISFHSVLFRVKARARPLRTGSLWMARLTFEPITKAPHLAERRTFHQGKVGGRRRNGGSFWKLKKGEKKTQPSFVWMSRQLRWRYFQSIVYRRT